MTATPPLLKQYQDIKRRYADAILLFRIGDFYETFEDDARLVARELDIVLTSKPMGKNLRVPLAGVPYHSLERHLATLIGRGHRVAICEQLSTAPAKGEARGNLETLTPRSPNSNAPTTRNAPDPFSSLIVNATRIAHGVR